MRLENDEDAVAVVVRREVETVVGELKSFVIASIKHKMDKLPSKAATTDKTCVGSNHMVDEAL